MTTTSSPTREERRQAKRDDPTRVGFGRLVAWSSSHAAQGANVLTLAFFTIYCTDTLGLSAAIVGILLLVSRFADAIGALVAGWLVDVAPVTRFGKARPFDLAIVGIWVFTALMFSTPGGFGEVAKYVWAFATYILVTAVFTPLFNANQPLYMARAFSTREAYSKLSARSGVIIGIVSLLAGVLVPIFIQQIGKSPTGWSILGIALAVPLAVFGLLRFFVIKESRDTESESLPRVRLADIALVLRTNPYLWIVAGIQLLGAIVGNVGVGTYYFRYIVGNVALQGVIGLLNVLAIPILAILPPLVKRFSVSRVIAAAAVFSTIGYVIYAFAGANLGVLVAAGVFTAIGALPASFLVTILIIDNATFNEWKGNRRLESVGGGVGSFAMSAGGGIAAGIAGLWLGAVGYDGTKATQSAAAIRGIVTLMSWVPATFSILIVLVSMIYYLRFERRLPTITAEVETIRATASISVPVTSAPVNANPTTPLVVAADEVSDALAERVKDGADDATRGPGA